MATSPSHSETCSACASKARTIGAQALAWTPMSRGPRSPSSSHALATPASSGPAPTGMTTQSGVRPPSCSHSSRPSVLSPSSM